VAVGRRRPYLGGKRAVLMAATCPHCGGDTFRITLGSTQPPRCRNCNRQPSRAYARPVPRRHRYEETDADREQAAYDDYRYGGATDAA
jgi:hypothetical protein